MRWDSNSTLVRVAKGFGVSLLVNLGCASSAAIEYPDTLLQTPAISVHLSDGRTASVARVRDRGPLERNERETFAEVFPEAGFLPRVQERLNSLASSGPTEVVVNLTVERADVTFFSDYMNEFVRYDVTLRIEIRAASGELLNRGSSAAWRQLPKEQATDASRLDTHIQAALDAFDRYFADEARLERLNADLEALSRRSPTG